MSSENATPARECLWNIEFRAPDYPGEVGGHYHNERMGVMALDATDAVTKADLPHGCHVLSVLLAPDWLQPSAPTEP